MVLDLLQTLSGYHCLCSTLISNVSLYLVFNATGTVPVKHPQTSVVHVEDMPDKEKMLLW